MSTESDHQLSAERYFVEALRKAIDTSDLSQQAIADEMTRRGHRFHQSTIYKVLRGDRKVTLGEAIDLASIVGMPLSEMTVPKHEQAMSKETRRAAEHMRSIRESTRGLILRQRQIKWLLSARDDWAADTREAATTWDDPGLAERAFRLGLKDAEPDPDGPPEPSPEEESRMFDEWESRTQRVHEYEYNG